MEEKRFISYLQTNKLARSLFIQCLYLERRISVDKQEKEYFDIQEQLTEHITEDYFHYVFSREEENVNVSWDVLRLVYQHFNGDILFKFKEIEEYILQLK